MRTLFYIGLIYAAYRLLKKGYDMTDDQTLYMAKTIFGESRGESQNGQIAVGHTILNRVKAGGWYGASIKDVVLKPYQFSCWNQGDVNRELIINKTSQQLLPYYELSKKIINGTIPDNTGGATHYHAKGVTPYWAAKMTKTATIGNHVFYA